MWGDFAIVKNGAFAPVSYIKEEILVRICGVRFRMNVNAAHEQRDSGGCDRCARNYPWLIPSAATPAATAAAKRSTQALQPTTPAPAATTPAATQIVAEMIAYQTGYLQIPLMLDQYATGPGIDSVAQLESRVNACFRTEHLPVPMAGLDETVFDEGDDLRPQSMQPVIYTNGDGERQIEIDALGVQIAWSSSVQCSFRGALSTRNSGKPHFLREDAFFPVMLSTNGKKRKRARRSLSTSSPFPDNTHLAAVWKLWKNPKTKNWEKTFAVLTGEPNELMAPIHDRMTTFLEPREYEYLAPSERAPVHLLRILPAAKMASAPIPANLR